MDNNIIEEGIIIKDPETGVEKIQNKEGLWAIIDADGCFVTSYLYKDIGFFNKQGLAIAQDKNFLFGVVDTLGREIVHCKYDFIDFRDDGFIRVELDGLYGLFNRNGDEILQCKYKYINNISNDMFVVKNERALYGFADKIGNEVVPCKYEFANDFHEGMAAVENLYKKYGFIDRRGNIMIPFKYLYAGSFNKGIAPVVNYNGLWGYIEYCGNEIVPCKYDSMEELESRMEELKIGYTRKKRR